MLFSLKVLVTIATLATLSHAADCEKGDLIACPRADAAVVPTVSRYRPPPGRPTRAA
jgi:hypothetical protein